MKQYRWASIGDINAFFGLVLDNVAGLLLIVSLLYHTFDFPVAFTLRYMIPGTAIGVLIGDIAFFILALQLAAKTKSQNVTAMPLGLDTPSTFGMIFFVLGPAFVSAKESGLDVDAAAKLTWQIGICSIFVSGLFKLGCSFGSNWLRKVVPRAGLLGSLASIALVIISFLPLLEILNYPLVGLVAMAILLTALVGRVPLPMKVPGTVAGLIVAGGIYYFMRFQGLIEVEKIDFSPQAGLFPTEWMSAFTFSWVNAFGESMTYMPIVIPFAVATVVGGIDCAESASAAGDDYSTNAVIGVEALATLLASLCGAVVQTTPYIGHPAYKAMGGRAAYTLATAIVMGLLGISGLFGYFYLFIPKAAVYPILIFVGLEISAQSFLATPRRHYPAVALACVPALAYLALFFVMSNDPNHPQRAGIEVTNMLANGFILTSLFWSSALAMTIDRKMNYAALFYLIAAACTLFGIIHSPYFKETRMLLPFSIGGLPEQFVLDKSHLNSVLSWTLGYLLVAGILWIWGSYLRATDQLTPDHDEVLEMAEKHQSDPSP